MTNHLSRSGVAARAFEDADGEEKDGGDEGEDSCDRDADDAEGKADKPDDGVEDEREQGQRPAEDEEDAEEEEFDHQKSFPAGAVGGRILGKNTAGG